MSEPRGIRLAVAGFGPFPGVPKNPSGEIVRALAKKPRFRAAGIILETTILETAYAAAGAALQKLIATQPAAIVLFGVAGGAKHIRVETIARNRASLLHPDHARFTPRARKLNQDGVAALRVRGAAMHIRAAIRATGARAELSSDAGSYLCNAIYYQALANTAALSPAPLTFFIHVPPVSERGFSLAMLIRAGEGAVWAAASEARKRRSVSPEDS